MYCFSAKWIPPGALPLLSADILEHVRVCSASPHGVPPKGSGVGSQSLGNPLGLPEMSESGRRPRTARDAVTSCLLVAGCLCFPQALTQVSQDCFPLLDGCRKNRQKWQALAEQQEEKLVNGDSGPAPRS